MLQGEGATGSYPITEQPSFNTSQNYWTTQELKLIKGAVFFMSLPRTSHLSYEQLIDFLRHKGLNDSMIE